jgi:hypothetical protein
VRRCKNKCGVELLPARKCTDIVSKKGYCSIACLDGHTRVKNSDADAKKKAREFKEMKDRVESQGAKSKLMTRAQAAFNAYIRARDANQPCISCDSTRGDGDLLTGSRFDAGHYRSRGATPELRFNEDNCFKQCVKCNRNMSGNVANMRIGIMKRIGEERLARVEGNHSPARYTADDLRSIEKEYKQKLKQLEVTT